MAGLNEGEKIRLSPPDKPENYRLNRLDPDVIAAFDKPQQKATIVPEQKPDNEKRPGDKMGRRGAGGGKGPK